MTADLLALWQFSFIEKISIKNCFKSFTSLRYLEKKRVLLDNPISAVNLPHFSNTVLLDSAYLSHTVPIIQLLNGHAQWL